MTARKGEAREIQRVIFPGGTVGTVSVAQALRCGYRPLPEPITEPATPSPAEPTDTAAEKPPARRSRGRRTQTPKTA